MTRLAVLDASAVGDFLLDAEQHPSVEEVLRATDTAVVVPHLCDVEVASWIRSLIARRLMTSARADDAIAHYSALTLQRVEHVPLLTRILSLRDNFSAYDATYVALAESLGASLYTADHRLARAVREHTEVDVVEV